MIKATIPWTAKQIAKMFDNKCLCFDNAVQRGEVWDKKRKSLLIDSMLRGYPIPPMFTIKTSETVETPKGNVAVFDCIDGKQRCYTINAFKNNQLVLEGLAPIGDTELNGMTYNDLPEYLKDEFDSYSITVYYFTEITDDEVCEMMSRLNNGKPLSGVENARIKAKNLSAIISLGCHPLFTENMTETAIKSYHNEDIVLKTALQIFEQENELSTKNVKDAYERIEFNENQVTELCRLFDNVYSMLSAFKDDERKEASYALKKIVKKTNLVSVIYAVYENPDIITMKNMLTDFFSKTGGSINPEYINSYNEACTNGTNHSANVIARNDALRSAFDEYTVF